jgi:hypothetical protein
MTGGAVGAPLGTAVTLAVAEPDATGVFVPHDEEGPIAQAAMTAHKAASATRMPAREETDCMGVSFPRGAQAREFQNREHNNDRKLARCGSG